MGWPWPGTLCSLSLPSSSAQQEKTKWKSSWVKIKRGVHKANVSFSYVQFWYPLSAKWYFYHEGKKTNEKNEYTLQSQGFPNYWDSRKLGIEFVMPVRKQIWWLNFGLSCSTALNTTSAKEGNVLSTRGELCFTYSIENTEDKYENEKTSVPHTNLNLAVIQIFPLESLWRLGG